MMLTANSTVEVRRGTTGDWTDLTRMSGLAAWQGFDTHSMRPIPSISPILNVQLLATRSASVVLTVDDNDATNPLFFFRSGDVFQVRLRREGVGSGRPERIFEGPMMTDQNQAPGGARTWRCVLSATAVTETTQS